MDVRIVSYLGREGFGERFLGEVDGPAGPSRCELRWAPRPRAGDPENRLARLRDAGILIQAWPDPLVPRVLAVTPAWNGLAVVSEPTGGVALSDLPERPLPEPVVMEILAQVAGLLDRFYTRQDPRTGEMLRTLHRNVSTECIHLRPDGGIRVTGFDKMTTGWSARSAETSAMALNPGARLAPEQMAGKALHASDVYLLGLVAVDLLVNPDRASQFSRQLAMCSIDDSEGFIELRDELLGDPRLGLSEAMQALLRDILQERPEDRPAAGEVARRASMAGADAEALADFATRLPAVEEPEGMFHQFVGRTMEVRPEALGPAAPTPAAPPTSALDAPDPSLAAAVDPPEPPTPATPPPPAAPPISGPIGTFAPGARSIPPEAPRPREPGRPPAPPPVVTVRPRTARPTAEAVGFEPTDAGGLAAELERTEPADEKTLPAEAPEVRPPDQRRLLLLALGGAVLMVLLILLCAGVGLMLLK